MPTEFTDIWNTTILNWATVGQVTLAFAALLGGILARTLSRILLRRLTKLAGYSTNRFDDTLVESMKSPLDWTLLFGGIYFALRIIPLPSEPIDIDGGVITFYKGFITIMIAWFAIHLSDGLFVLWQDKAAETPSKMDDQILYLLKRSCRVAIILIGGGLFLQNLGYNIGSLLAGIGIGGAALAFAAKDTLSNLFGAVTIFVDKPFVIGDWVEIGGVEGTVEKVRLRTSTVRTFANSLITLPNGLLTNSNINNWSRMRKRRIMMTVGLTYDTTADQMQAAVEAFRKIAARDENILDDLVLINFDNFGSTSLDIFIYCFTKTTAWGEYLEAKQQFMLKIMRAVKELNLSFAFPTQSIHIESIPENMPMIGTPIRPDRPN